MDVSQANTKTLEEIIRNLKGLSPLLQKQALDFISYLKLRQTQKSENINSWNQFSLASALRGLEDDEFPDYKDTDLKETWQ